MGKKIRVSSRTAYIIIALIYMYTRSEIERLKLAFNWNLFFFLLFIYFFTLLHMYHSRTVRSSVFLWIFMHTHRSKSITLRFGTVCAKNLIRSHLSSRGWRWQLFILLLLYLFSFFFTLYSLPSQYRCLSSSQV